MYLAINILPDFRRSDHMRKRRLLALAAAFSMLTSTFTTVYANQVDLDVTGIFEEEYGTDNETEKYDIADEDTTDGDIVRTAVQVNGPEGTSVPEQTVADDKNDNKVTLGYSVHLESEDELDKDDVTKENADWYEWDGSQGF